MASEEHPDDGYVTPDYSDEEENLNSSILGKGKNKKKKSKTLIAKFKDIDSKHVTQSHGKYMDQIKCAYLYGKITWPIMAKAILITLKFNPVFMKKNLANLGKGLTLTKMKTMIKEG